MTNELEKPKKITEKLDDLEVLVNKVLDKLEEIATPKSGTPQIEGTIPQTPSNEISQPITIKYPVPMEYREVVSSVLNGNFGLTVEPMPDRPAFMLNIIVPEKYSNMSESEKKMNKVDLRTRIIGYAEGVNGVRQYAELVANNLGPELRANIIADRALLQ